MPHAAQGGRDDRVVRELVRLAGSAAHDTRVLVQQAAARGNRCTPTIVYFKGGQKQKQTSILTGAQQPAVALKGPNQLQTTCQKATEQGGIAVGMLGPVSPLPVCLYHDASPPLCGSLADDDDAVLQAVLMASLEQDGSPAELLAAGGCSSGLESQAAMLDAMSRPALVGPPESLSAYASEISSAQPARDALAKLSGAPRHLALLKVRGDGHCFWRAFAASLALGASWSGMLRSFEAHLDTLCEPCAAPAVAALRQLLGRNGTDAALALQALNEEGDSSRSDAAVAALRKCATEHMRVHADRFVMVADGDLEAYCERMEAMGPRTEGWSPAAAAAAVESFCPAYGGQPEMVALSEALRVRIDIIDLGEAGAAAGDKPPTTYSVGEGLEPAAPLVCLLRRGLHFHLLLPAAAEGEALLLPAGFEADGTAGSEQ